MINSLISCSGLILDVHKLYVILIFKKSTENKRSPHRTYCSTSMRMPDLRIILLLVPLQRVPEMPVVHWHVMRNKQQAADCLFLSRGHSRDQLHCVRLVCTSVGT